MEQEYGLLIGGIPYLRVGTAPAPIVVLNGGQAFMRPPSRKRFERETCRLKKLFPAGQSFLLLGYPESTPRGRSLHGLVDDFATALADLPRPIR